MNTSISSGYLLGIGSNLEPEHNIGKIIESLLALFPKLTLSRVLSIPPVGMNSHHDFLNMVVFIETSMDQDSLKSLCNEIETQLGRDRSDPASKTKDRPADLDILFKINAAEDLNTPANQITDEYFLYPLLNEVCTYLSGETGFVKQSGCLIHSANLTFGQTATTIYREATASDERVLQ